MMNVRTGFYIVLAALSLTGLFSCLGSGNNFEYELSPDAQLTAFSLSHDSLAALAATKFSIDQKRGYIFNYDSLPYLTDTTKIASRAIVRYTTGAGSPFAVRVEYLNKDTAWVSSGDTLRFAHQFDLRLYAPNETAKDYTVFINIHHVDPDSVQYHRAAIADLPEVTTPDWAALTKNCPDTLEVVACLGFLRPDEQKGLALIVKDKEDLRFAFSNDTVTYQLGTKIPENFPIAGFAIFNDRSFAGRLTVISSLQSVWATENGLYWTNLFSTQKALPVIEGGNAFSYNGEIWFINGRLATGGYNSKIYFSSDGGVVWNEKPKKTQPPVEFPLRQDATVVVDAEGKYFYIKDGQNRGGTVNDVWRVVLNSRLFAH